MSLKFQYNTDRSTYSSASMVVLTESEEALMEVGERRA